MLSLSSPSGLSRECTACKLIQTVISEEGGKYIAWLTHHNLERECKISFPPTWGEIQEREKLRRRKEKKVETEEPGSRRLAWLRRMADGESRSASEHILTVGRAVFQNSPNSLKSTCWSYWVVTLHVVAQEQWAHKGVSFSLSVELVRGAILDFIYLHFHCCKTPWDVPHSP